MKARTWMAVLFLAYSGAVLGAEMDIEAWAKELSGRINTFRVEEGLAPLELDFELCALAQAWAEHLGETGKPEHRSNLKSLMKEMGYSKMNENLYIGGRFPAVARALEAWQKSPGHRSNLLNPQIQKLGIGIGKAKAGKTFIVFNGAG